MILSRLIRHRSSPRFATSTPVLSSHISYDSIPPLYHTPPRPPPHAPDVPQVLVRLHLRPRAPPARKHALQHPRRVLGLPRERGAARRLVHHTQPLPDPPGSAPRSSPPSSPARGGTSPTPRGSARARRRRRPRTAREAARARTDTPPRRSSRRGSGGPPSEPTRTRRRSRPEREAEARTRGPEARMFFRIAPPLRLARADISSGAPRAPASPPPRRSGTPRPPGKTPPRAADAPPRH